MPTRDEIPYGWRSVVHRLKKKLPTNKPVSVRVVDKLENLADISFDGKKYIIRIAKGCPECMFNSLVHEYAHALDSWTHDFPEHSAAWGLWYHRVYNVVYETE